MSEDILDLEEFRERVQNDKALLLELLDIFVEDFKAKRKEMGEAVAQNDSGALKRLAHSLKGSSGNISAKSLRRVMLDLETRGKNGCLDGTQELLADMDKEFAALSERILVIKKELG